MGFTGTAFGSVMLFGEYAVAFHHTPAIVMGISESLTVDFCWRSDRQIQVTSALDSFLGSMKNFERQEHWLLVAHLMAHWPQTAQRGWEMRIHSDIPIAQGLGSSAALIVALVIALEKAHGQHLSPNSHKSLQKIVALLRGFSPHASGADCAAALHGGVVLYDPQLYKVTPLPPQLGPWYWAYTGYKTTTGTMLERFEHRWGHYNSLLRQIAAYTHGAVQCWSESHLGHLKTLMRAHHQVQVALGTFERPMLTLYNKLCQSAPDAAVKISGSGCGDGFVALGGMLPEGLFLESKQWGQFLTPAPYREVCDAFVG